MPSASEDRIADLDAIVVELYAVPPADFTAERARRMRAADTDLAAAIRAIPKPVVSASTVDLMARAGLLGDAMELAAQLREAQDEADAAEMTRLSRQRRQLVAALASQGAELAAQSGVAVSATARSDVEQTLNATMIDADAAAAVLSARLARPIWATGFGGVDLSDAVGGSIPVASDEGTAGRPDELAERRARRAAERAANDAEREAVQVEREASRVRAERDRMRERVDALHERVDVLRRDLDASQTEARHAEAEQSRLARAADEAEVRAQDAGRRARAAREAAGGAERADQ